MKKQKQTVLAINPGMRYLGIAVFCGPVLNDWSVKVVCGKRSPEKLDKIMVLIERLIDEHNPDIIVLKKFHSSRSSQYLNVLSKRIENLASGRNISLTQYSIEEIEAFYSPGCPINKSDLAELMCQRHPVLRIDYNKERHNTNPYYLRMFEAVALGMSCLYKDKY